MLGEIKAKGENEMNELKIFENKEFGAVRTVQIDDEIYFVGKDVATALGYADTFGALKKHVEEEDKQNCQNDSFETPRGMTVINESGLYALIFGSKLESAKRFKRWVTNEVLPQIRKTGQYQKPLSQQEMMRIQLGMIDDHEGRITKLENTMVIDYAQQQMLTNVVNKTVTEVLGGKSSPAYQQISKKVFRECSIDLNNYFGVNSRNNIPKKRFDEAMEYAKNWKPCTNTMMLINECNAQMSLDV